MHETIEVEFDLEELPVWARKIPVVVWLAERDLAYLIRVQSCKDVHERKFIVREAEKRYHKYP